MHSRGSNPLLFFIEWSGGEKDDSYTYQATGAPFEVKLLAAGSSRVRRYA